MRMKMLILLMTLIPTFVFANLGDTRAESDQRYGVEGIPWHIGKEDNGMIMYHPNRWAMLEWYNAQGIVRHNLLSQSSQHTNNF
jgi:hypothetical protein